VIRTIVVERWSLVRRLLPYDLYFWLKAVLLALIAVQLARLVWLLLTPVGPFGAWTPAQARLLPPQVQSTLIASVDPFFRGSQVAAATVKADITGLKLFGVRQEGSAGGGSAIIAGEDGEQHSFAVGEDVAPGVRLVGVAFDHVLLDMGGRQDRLALDDAEPAQAGAAPVVAGSPAAAPGSQPLTVAAIRQAVAFAPRNQGSRVTGVIVNPARDAALFRAAGFQQGDVIVAVNGARINSATDVAQLQSGLSPGARLALTVERGAQAVPISLNIAGN
jgi:general secretion pathway protein C